MVTEILFKLPVHVQSVIDLMMLITANHANAGKPRYCKSGNVRMECNFVNFVFFKKSRSLILAKVPIS